MSKASNNNSLLEAALQYATEMGWKVLPLHTPTSEARCSCGYNDCHSVGKHPRWHKADLPSGLKNATTDPALITKWWTRWPDANIAIVTGKESNLLVLDADSEETVKILKSLPDSPCVSTGKGLHYYCQYFEGIGNSVKVLRNLDTRAEGGYVVAPPSLHANGRQYNWQISPTEAQIINPQLHARLVQVLGKLQPSGNNVNRGNNKRKPPSELLNGVDHGERNQSINHLAGRYIRKGLSDDEIMPILSSFNEKCDPPLSEEEVIHTLESTRRTHQRRQSIENGSDTSVASFDSQNSEGSLASRIKEWVEEFTGEFSTSQLDAEFDLKTKPEKRNRSNILLRLVNDGLFRRVRYGRYRRVDMECQAIDWLNATTESFSIRWPLEIEEFVEVQPGDVVVIAGETNAGKSTFLVNLLNLNKQQKDGRKIHYFSSEIGPADLKQRIERFEEPLDTFDFNFYERSSNHADVIRPDDINIIDYLEMSDNFYQVGGYIREIHEQLNTGIAIIAIQKKAGAETGRGGDFSMEKAALYVTISQYLNVSGRLEGQEIRITKGKKWARDSNPNGLRRRFKIVHGSLIIPTTIWHKKGEHPKVELEED